MTYNPIFTTTVGQLPVTVYRTNEALGAAAAAEAAAVIRAAVRERGVANIIVATGNSQLTFLASLAAIADLPWDHVNVFHMDEYVNLPPGHSASFPAFLHRHLLDYVKVQPSSLCLALRRILRPRAGSTRRCCATTRPTSAHWASARMATWRSTTRPTPISPTRSGSRWSRWTSARDASR